LEREIIQTLDGSTTIHLKEWDECYHSKHGAIQEAQHVFIKNGLSLFPNQSVSILEIGFGTGLNAFISFLESQHLNQQIHYFGVEAYPVNATEVLAMNYVEELKASSKKEVFHKMHESNWNEKIELTTDFELTKRKQFFDDIDDIPKNIKIPIYNIEKFIKILSLNRGGNIVFSLIYETDASGQNYGKTFNVEMTSNNFKNMFVCAPKTLFAAMPKDMETKIFSVKKS
jgi:hypothetical protein